MTVPTNEPVPKSTRRQQSVNLIISFRRAYDNIDPRFLVGLSLILMAFMMVAYPPTNVTLRLVQFGIDVKLYAVCIAIVGSWILRYPRSHWYSTAALLAFFPYWWATWGFIVDTSATPTPLVLYSLLFFFLLRAK